MVQKLQWEDLQMVVPINQFEYQGMVYKIVDMPMEAWLGYVVGRTEGSKPFRVLVYNPSEPKKFLIQTQKTRLVEDENGEQGLIAYMDYFYNSATTPQTASIGVMYVVKEYRELEIAKRFSRHIGELTTERLEVNGGRVCDEAGRSLARWTNETFSNVNVFYEDYEWDIDAQL